MKFTIVVPFLDEQLHIAACVRSILDQTYPADSIEPIFVDNGSSDASRSIVERFEGIRILDEPRKDPYLARNRGIAQASGDYVVLLDADCVAAPSWLDAMRSAIRTGNADIVLGNLEYPEPRSAWLQHYQDYYNSKTAYLLDGKHTSCYYGHAGNMAVRRTVFDEVGPFKGLPIVGDTEILHALLAHRSSAVITHAPDAVVTHLEVKDFRSCLAKIVDAGGYTRDMRGLHGFRPLGLQEKLGAMRRCCRDHGYAIVQRIRLCVTLAVGWSAFEFGRRTAFRGTDAPVD